MIDDGLEFFSKAVANPRCAFFGRASQGSASVWRKTSNNGPVRGLVVSLLARLAFMSVDNLRFLAFLFIDSDSCNTRLQKGDGDRQADQVVIELFQYCARQHAIVESDGWIV